jgi:phage pi2 protein 07
MTLLFELWHQLKVRLLLPKYRIVLSDEDYNELEAYDSDFIPNKGDYIFKDAANVYVVIRRNNAINTPKVVICTVKRVTIETKQGIAINLNYN